MSLADVSLRRYRPGSITKAPRTRRRAAVILQRQKSAFVSAGLRFQVVDRRSTLFELSELYDFYGDCNRAEHARWLVIEDVTRCYPELQVRDCSAPGRA